MSIANRIKEVRKQSGLNQTQFAERIGISMNGLSMIERGVNNPSKQTLSLICNEFDINKVWLELGEGEMKPPDLDPIAEVVSSIIRNGKQNPFYKNIVVMVEQYEKLDESSKIVINNLLKNVMDQLKNDPE